SGKILAVARSATSTDAFVAQVRQALEKHLPATDLEDEHWLSFARRLHYISLDAKDPSNYSRLKALLDAGIENRIFYYATRSDLYAPISCNLRAEGIAN